MARTGRHSSIGGKFASPAGFNMFVYLLLVLSACAATAMPVQEMSDARQAIRVAKSVAPDADNDMEIKKVEKMLKQAEDALSDGQFAQAKQHAISARESALQIQEQYRIHADIPENSSSTTLQ